MQLIPETQARTTLAARAVGERVNLEADVIGKYVARCPQGPAPRPAGSGAADGGQLRAAGSDGRMARRLEEAGSIALVERALGEIRKGGWSSSPTTRTARTRATS